jgi:sterol desaturase/sphingolipid hydroxylase (fatty acid hydroxylase superfamily)
LRTRIAVLEPTSSAGDAPQYRRRFEYQSGFRQGLTTMSAFTVDDYNWQAALGAVLLGAVIMTIGRYLIFKVPAFQRMQAINAVEDQKRLAQEKYPALIKQGRIAGFASLTFFFVVILPFATTLEARSVGKILLEIFVILMVYDFFYYLTHRFVLHGNALKRVHGIHHQARDPSYIDAHYVHPIEISIGLWLFFGTVIGHTLIAGPAHIASMVVCFVAFMTLNLLNHVYFKLPHYPFKTLDWIVARHHVHHESMRRGNYGTITMFYDYVFGTLDS